MMGIGVETFEVQSGFSIGSVPPEIVELISRMERRTLFYLNNFVFDDHGVKLSSLDTYELMKVTMNIEQEDLLRVFFEVNDLKHDVSKLAVAYRRFVETYGSDDVLREELSKITDPDEKLYKLMEILGFEVIRLSKLVTEILRKAGLDPVVLPIWFRRALKDAENDAVIHIKKKLIEKGVKAEINTLDDVNKIINQLPQDLADEIISYVKFSATLTIDLSIRFDAILTKLRVLPKG